MRYNEEFLKIFDYAKNKADAVEIMLSEDNSFSVKIHQQEIESFNYADSKGISVRVIKDNKAGYAYSEKFDEESFKMMVDEAIANSKYSQEEDKPLMDNYPDIENKPEVYNEELNNVDINDKIQMAKDIEKLGYEADKRVFNVPYALYGDSTHYMRIANSKGLRKEDKRNSAFAYAVVLTEENEDKRTGMEFNVGRDFSKFSAKKLAEESVKKGIALLGGEVLETGKYAAVLNNEMMSTMLDTFSGIFNAKTVQEGKSLLKGKLNEQVASALITITDDALHPEGFATSAFDSEGYPSQKTLLIDNGRLVSYIHNTQTAAKDGVESTGNAARGIKGTLGISTTNFCLEPGLANPKDLFGKFDKVVEIVALQGLHSGANSISGDFSLSGEGFLYEKGVKQHSLKPFTVSGNILQLLHDVTEVANDFKFNTSSVGASAVLIKELAFSG
jgi:PmbA protein